MTDLSNASIAELEAALKRKRDLKRAGLNRDALEIRRELDLHCRTKYGAGLAAIIARAVKASREQKHAVTNGTEPPRPGVPA